MRRYHINEYFLLFLAFSVRFPGLFVTNHRYMRMFVLPAAHRAFAQSECSASSFGFLIIKYKDTEFVACMW